jgi:hypothetical protein
MSQGMLRRVKYKKYLRFYQNLLCVTLAIIIASFITLFLQKNNVSAEETPMSVSLSYVANLSNWGPKTATGAAEIWRNDAEVRLRVDGLTQLQNQAYSCWLANLQDGKFVLVGRFNVSANGSAVMDVTLKGSFPNGYTTVLVTVQPEPDSQSDKPSQLYSIAGFFPGTSAQQKPTVLPSTGRYAEQPPFATQSLVEKSQVVQNGVPHWLSFAMLGISILSLAFVIRRQRTIRR